MRSRLLARIVLPILGVAWSLGPAQAQLKIDSAVIAGRPGCTGCIPQLTLVRTFGTSSDPHVTGMGSTLTLDSRGRAFVMAVGQQQVIVYDSSGRYVAALGKAGSGPGENDRIVRFAVGPRDSIFILGANGRGAVYSPSLEYIRPYRVPDRATAIYPDTGGTTIVLAQLRTTLRIGWPLHRADSLGEVVSSFGATDLRIPPGCTQCLSRTTVPATSTVSIWFDHVAQYRVERWERTGNTARVLVREATWLPRFTRDRPLGGPVIRGQSPADLVELLREAKWYRTAAAVDSRQRLWYSYFALDHPSGPGYYLEVIDATAGRLLYMGKHPDHNLRWVNGDYAYKHVQSADGYVRIDLFRVELKQPGG